MACSGYQGTQTVERATTNYIKCTTRHEEETQRIETAFLRQTTGGPEISTSTSRVQVQTSTPVKISGQKKTGTVDLDLKSATTTHTIRGIVLGLAAIRS